MLVEQSQLLVWAQEQMQGQQELIQQGLLETEALVWGFAQVKE